MGAGILPVTFIKGTIYLLLGKEYKMNYWCDFGGSSYNYEPTFETAIREGYEELDGFLGNKDELKNLVTNNLLKKIEIDRYTTYVFFVDYEKIITLPYYFNNHRKFIEREINYKKKEGMFEKSKIKLFSKSELIQNDDFIRPFYREVLDELLKCENQIIKKNRMYDYK